MHRLVLLINTGTVSAAAGRYRQKGIPGVNSIPQPDPIAQGKVRFGVVVQSKEQKLNGDNGNRCRTGGGVSGDEPDLPQPALCSRKNRCFLRTAAE